MGNWVFIGQTHSGSLRKDRLAQALGGLLDPQAGL